MGLYFKPRHGGAQEASIGSDAEGSPVVMLSLALC